MAIKTLDSKRLAELKNLFFLLEVNLSSHMNGFLYKSDFERLSREKKWKKAHYFKRMFECFGQKEEDLKLTAIGED